MCSFVLFLVCTIAVLSVYNVNGVGWDFLSHYLNARTISSSYLYSHLSIFANKVSINVNQSGTNHTYYVTPSLVIGKKIYFDDVWEPLPAVMMGALILLLGGLAMPVYIILLIALLFVASYVTAKNLDVDPLMLSSIIAGPFMISYTILYNGNEILASSFVLLTIGFIMAKKGRAGAFAALMALSKYASMFLLPLVLFLRKRNEIIKAATLFIIITLPWLVFNYLAFGSPIESYTLQLIEIQPQSNTLMMFFSTLFSIIGYPLIILIVGAAAVLYLQGLRKRGNAKALTMKMKNIIKSRQAWLLASFFLLAFVEFAFVYNKTQGPIRLGYMLYLSLSIAAVLVISSSSIEKLRVKISKIHFELREVLPYVAFSISMILVLVLYSNWSHIGFNALGSLGFKNSDFTNAVGALSSHNLGGCNIVSNAWPYMNYYNVTAYSPYYCNSTVQKMPIVIFNKVGVSNYCTGSVDNISNISQTFRYENFSIYLPNNYACIR